MYLLIYLFIYLCIYIYIYIFIYVCMYLYTYMICGYIINTSMPCMPKCVYAWTCVCAFVDLKSTYPQIYKCIQYAMWAAGLPGNSQRPHCSTYMWFYTRICAWRSPRYLAAARGVAFPCLDHVSIQCWVLSVCSASILLSATPACNGLSTV